MDADLDPLLAGRLAEELARVPAPPARAPRPRSRSLPVRSAVLTAVVLLIALVAGRELASLRTPATTSSAARALYLGNPYQAAGWVQIDPLTLTDLRTRPLLAHTLGSDESVISSADGSTIVVSHYGQLVTDHSVYDARTGTPRTAFTVQEPMIVDGISADGTELIGRVGSANHSLTDVKLIVSTADGHIVRRIPAVDGCCVDQIAYDPALASIFYVLDPRNSPPYPAGLQQVTLLVQSTADGTTRTLPLPGIQAGRVLSFGSPTVASVPTLFFPATALSPDGRRFAALSLDGTTLVLVDTATLQVTQKTLVRSTSWRDLFAPLVAYGKESADSSSWSAVFSPDGRTLYAYQNQTTHSDPAGSPDGIQTTVLDRIDVERGAITAVAPRVRPFTDFISALVPSFDGQSLYVIQSDRVGLGDRTPSVFLRRLDARSLAVLAERPIDLSTYDLREFQAPGQTPAVAAQTAPPSPSIPAPSPTDLPTATPQAGAITGRLGYPSEFIPPLTVYAISTADQRVWYSADVPRFPPLLLTPRPTGTFAPGTEPRYTITGVAPGTYYVLAYRNDGQQPVGPGLYSRRVACRTGGAPSTCGPADDFSLAIVTVNAGQTTTGIDVEDWVPPAGPGQPSPSFPPRPTPR
jgi:hypothetical protein